ncbi:uncharacterized protein ARMOST_20472 [Armillaria ostoyae]|uniref:Uncharacterized protein n=1 Tax=Armillaria ostoyae TaxID=47428 RepID=A0A284S7F8_ARMOS|nr:uncharacterized protein ARMOST_20472 [Armillaria ostoyae]
MLRHAAGVTASPEWKEWKTKCTAKRKEMALKEKEKEKEVEWAEHAVLKEKRDIEKAEKRMRKAEEKVEKEREKAVEKEWKTLARIHAQQKRKHVQERARMEKAARSLAAKEAKAAAATKLALKKARLRTRRQKHMGNEEGTNGDSADTHNSRKEAGSPGALPTSLPATLKPRPCPRPLYCVVTVSDSQPVSPACPVLQHPPSVQLGPPEAILPSESEAEGSCAESLASSGPRWSSRAKKEVKR